MKKICIVTGTRAEYGLLKGLMGDLKDCKEIELQILVTGMHLSPEFGLTYRQIESDGFKISEKVEMLLSSDDDTGIIKSMGIGMILFSDALTRLNPDILIVLGDRFEIFAVTTAAAVLKIPVAHLCGGDTTEGAYDEFFRHCISKMSYLHFTSTETSRKRVIQLGESPERVFNVGDISLDNIKNMDFYSRKELEERLDVSLSKKFFVIVFHPTTLEKNTAENQINEILEAVENLEEQVIFIKGNADSNGRIINKKVEEFVAKKTDKRKIFTSLTVEEYLSLVKISCGLLGNSSSGIVELPGLKVGNLNIGDRQKGREQATSTLNCNPLKEEIIKNIEYMKSREYKGKVQNVISPYGDGDATKKIVKILKNIDKIELKKIFYSIPF